MEIKFTSSHLHLSKIGKNPLLLMRVASGALVLGILVFLGISFFRTVYSAVLAPTPVEESQLISKQATLDTPALDAVTKESEKRKESRPPAVVHDLFTP